VSQFPYTPPPGQPYGYTYGAPDPNAALLAPAKRASIGMFILAGLMLPCGCIAGASAMVLAGGAGRLPPESMAQLQELESQLGSSGITLVGLLRFMAIGIIVFGILFLVMGVFVRRGGLGSIITAIILCCVVGLFTGFAVVSGLITATQGQAQAMLPTCLWGGVLALVLFSLVSLVQAARNAGQISRVGYPIQQPYGHNPAAYYPQHQPQAWQQPGQPHWPQPGWPPPQQPQQQQQPPPPDPNWPPPPPPSSPT